MSKRKKPETITVVRDDLLGEDGPTHRRKMTSEEMAAAQVQPEPDDHPAAESERTVMAPPDMAASILDDDPEMTVNLSGDELPLPGRDDYDEPTVTVPAENLEGVDHLVVQRKHLRGLLEALVFASDAPIKTRELAKLASAQAKQVTELLGELKQEYAGRGVHLEEVAGGWVFRTSAQYAPFIRDLTKQKPVRLTRAQVETLAIIAYRQPITRPEVDDVRGVDSGPVLKLLLERDLVRILGQRDEPGRPMIYGTTTQFLEFVGLKSLKDLPTLREFTELTDESRQKFEEELGEPPNEPPPEGVRHESMSVPAGGEHAFEDVGPDDLEPVEEDGGESPTQNVDAVKAPDEHAADHDDPTITSGAPAGAERDTEHDDHEV